MAGQQRLVNKQFNSPIGLYSEANVREILDRESQMLANGAVGIDFRHPASAKPASLANSAVLRMLEEEASRQRDGQSPGAKRVAWPPPRDGEDELAEQEAAQPQGGAQYSTNHFSPIQQRPVTPQPQPQGQQPAFNSQLLLQQVPQPAVPHQQGIRPQSPPPFSQSQQQQQQWAPVHTPRSVTSPKPQQQQQPTAQYQAQPQQGPQPSYQSPPAKAFEPPPTTITLRPEVPISQAPAPIVTSQPATATLKGGKNLRGDLKWPPENVRTRMEDENRLRMELAQGPAMRPRRVQKDYSGFFAQHALNSSYPGYKIPPGTQYYDHHPVM